MKLIILSLSCLAAITSVVASPSLGFTYSLPALGTVRLRARDVVAINTLIRADLVPIQAIATGSSDLNVIATELILLSNLVTIAANNVSRTIMNAIADTTTPIADIVANLQVSNSLVGTASIDVRYSLATLSAYFNKYDITEMGNALNAMVTDFGELDNTLSPVLNEIINLAAINNATQVNVQSLLTPTVTSSLNATLANIVVDLNRFEVPFNRSITLLATGNTAQAPYYKAVNTAVRTANATVNNFITSLLALAPKVSTTLGAVQTAVDTAFNTSLSELSAYENDPIVTSGPAVTAAINQFLGGVANAIASENASIAQSIESGVVKIQDIVAGVMEIVTNTSTVVSELTQYIVNGVAFAAECSTTLVPPLTNETLKTLSKLNTCGNVAVAEVRLVIATLTRLITSAQVAAITPSTALSVCFNNTATVSNDVTKTQVNVCLEAEITNYSNYTADLLKIDGDIIAYVADSVDFNYDKVVACLNSRVAEYNVVLDNFKTQMNQCLVPIDF